MGPGLSNTSLTDTGPHRCIHSTGLLGPGLSNTSLTDTGPHGYSHPLHRAVGAWPVQHITYRYRATRLQSSTPQGCWDLACPTHHLQIQGHTATVIHSTGLLGPGLSNTSLTDTGPHGYSHPLHRAVGAWPVQHITYRYRATRLQSSTPQSCWDLACPTHHLQIQGHTATVIHSTGLLGPGLSNTSLTDTGPHGYSHPLHRAVGAWPVQHITYRYRATRLQSSTPQGCWDLACPTHHLQIQGHTATVIHSTGLLGPGLSNTPLIDTGPHGYSHPLHRAVGAWPVQHITYRYRATRLQSSTPQGCWGLACPTHHLQIQGHTATVIHSTGLLGPGLSNTSLTDTGPHGYSHPLHRAVGAWPVQHITYRYRATRLQSSTPQGCWGLACPPHHLQIQGHTATVIHSTELLGPGLSNTPLTDTGPHGYSHPLHRTVWTWPVQHITYRYRATGLQSSTPQTLTK